MRDLLSKEAHRMKREDYDVIVIGAGSGLRISSAAAAAGHRVALIEESDFGGTCLNRGCIPSKILIHAGEVANTIRRGKEFGVNARIDSINWRKIQKSVWDPIRKSSTGIEQSNEKNKNITLFKDRGAFIGEREILVNGRILVGKKVVICAGTRPRIPPIDGIKHVPYITSDQALGLKVQPLTLGVIGSGYIGAELAHFFSSVGTRVTMFNRGTRLIKREDTEIGETFTSIVGNQYTLLHESSPTSVKRVGKKIAISYEGKRRKKGRVLVDQLLMATGRVPNTDILDVQKCNIRMNNRGYIRVNEFMETSVKNVWAIGDIAGNYLFKHSANLEADLVAQNLFGRRKKGTCELHRNAPCNIYQPRNSRSWTD